MVNSLTLIALLVSTGYRKETHEVKHETYRIKVASCLSLKYQIKYIYSTATKTKLF